ncbi:MAG: nuclear transport factor 2 family protein [Acetobacteraceae bacterium]|nr:nuclear transport factor 2 family protein [Acetobacteraceae bacterium]
MDFPTLLARFADAVRSNDGAGLAALFTPDGVYEDGFFGPHPGRPAIAAMLQRFHDGGRDYWWEFTEPLHAGDLGYARWRFSYASRRPGAEGKPVLFEGISRFRLQDGLIAHYFEVFDRGLALAQQDYPPAGIASVVAKAAARQNAKPENRAHLARFEG